MFDFFGLSRELRDEIYALSLAPRSQARCSGSVRTWVAHAPSAVILLVNQQFRIEYLEAAQRNSILVFHGLGDSSCFVALADVRRLPEWAFALHKVEFRLWIECGCSHTNSCDGMRKLQAHAEWTSEILRQLEVPQAMILVCLSNWLGSRRCEAQALSIPETFNCLPGFQDLIVYYGWLQFVNESFEGPKLRFVYDADTKQLEPVGPSTDDLALQKRIYGFSGDKRMWYELLRAMRLKTRLKMRAAERKDVEADRTEMERVTKAERWWATATALSEEHGGQGRSTTRKRTSRDAGNGGREAIRPLRAEAVALSQTTETLDSLPACLSETGERGHRTG